MYSRNQITGILFHKKAHKMKFSVTDHQAFLEIRQQLHNTNQELSPSGSHHVRGEHAQKKKKGKRRLIYFSDQL